MRRCSREQLLKDRWRSNCKLWRPQIWTWAAQPLRTSWTTLVMIKMMTKSMMHVPRLRLNRRLNIWFIGSCSSTVFSTASGWHPFLPISNFMHRLHVTLSRRNSMVATISKTMDILDSCLCFLSSTWHVLVSNFHMDSLFSKRLAQCFNTTMMLVWQSLKYTHRSHSLLKLDAFLTSRSVRPVSTYSNSGSCSSTIGRCSLIGLATDFM